MKIESIFKNLKASEILLDDEKYYVLHTQEKVEYVASLLNCYRLNLINYIKYMEITFKKNQIHINELYEIELNFTIWCENLYQTLSHYVDQQYFHEGFFWGFEDDELFVKFKDPSEVFTEVPKDDLLNYVKRTKEYLKIYPLNSKIFDQLKIAPDKVIYINDFEENDESNFNEITSEGYAIIAGEKILLPYPFYSVAKYLEESKAFSEESSVSQNDIHLRLKLRFATPRIKQWKKIKGRTNPIISKIFEINSRGYVWIKKNVKVF